MFILLKQNGWSPLLTASEHGHEEVVRQLLRNNARVDVFDEVHHAHPFSFCSTT